MKRTVTKKHIRCDCADCRELETLSRKAQKDEKTRKARRETERLARPPNLVSRLDACSAIDVLRLYHHQVVENMAVSLRSRFEAGELFGNLDTPGGSDDDAKGANAILEACRQEIVGREDACIVLAFSPSTEGIRLDENWRQVLVKGATEALAADVLRVARFRRFYEMKPTESLMVW